MQDFYNAATTNINNVESSLADFYNLINRLSNIRFLRFTGKEDEADVIQWTFVYRKRRFTLQYNIYTGVSLFSEKQASQKLVNKLASLLSK